MRHDIVYMDNDCIEKAISYYDFEESISSNIVVVNISVEGKEYTKSFFEAKAREGENVILSVARADFPFKGYLVGLVKWFNECSYNDYILKIVAYGKDFDVLKELVDNSKAKSRIMLIGKTDSNQLSSLYEEAKIYIGMGTTVIEATRSGCIAIPVAYDTYDVICQSFFCDDYLNLIANIRKMSCFDSLIDIAIKMNSSDLYLYMEKGYELVNEHYSAQKNAERIEKIFDDNQYDDVDLLKKLLGLAYKFRETKN